MIYGYCRISTSKQNIERQERNILKEYPDALIIKEVYSGTKINRVEFDRLLNIIVPGDKIVFDSVSRMSRNASEGFKLYESLFNKNIELVFLKEPHINTMTYKNALKNNIKLTGTNVDYILKGVNQYLMELAREQIKIEFEQSEKEVKDLHQRTKEGILTAKLNGKQIGRAPGVKFNTKKSIESKKQIIKYSKDFEGTLKDKDVMKLIGISRNSYYKYKKQLLNDIKEY